MNDRGTSRKRRYSGPVIIGLSGLVLNRGMNITTAHTRVWISNPVYFVWRAVMIRMQI